MNWLLLRRPRPILETILEKSVPPRYYVSEAARERAKAKLKSPPDIPSIWHTNRSGAVAALPCSAALLMVDHIVHNTTNNIYTRPQTMLLINHLLN